MRIFSALVPTERGRRAIAEMAGLQHGLIGVEQLRHAGVTRAAVRRLVADRTLTPVLARVHALGAPELGSLARHTAVCLHFGHDLVVSHQSAAELWGLIAPAETRISVSLIGRGLRPRTGIEIHRVASLHPADVRLRHGLPVAAPARALLDFAARATPARCADALAAARLAGLLTDVELAAALDRAPYRTGTAALARLLATPVGLAITRSRFERRLLDLIERARIPLPEVNAVVNGHEVDFVWRAAKVILEADSWAHHRSRDAFERDRARDQHHVAHGFTVVRITWRQLTEDPLGTVATIASALAANR